MENVLVIMEEAIFAISEIVWPFFLPFMLVVGAFTAIRSILIVQKQTTKKSSFKIKNAIGPAAISLGAMIGTGAIIGVLGALSKYASSGEINIEAMAVWALIGSIIMVPVSYSEALNAKIMHKTPREYITILLNSKFASIYAVSFIALTVFGFTGFQFSGIDSVATIIAQEIFYYDLTLLQRYIFIVVPVILFIGGLVLSKKHERFMSAMTYMIGTAVIGYFIFFTLFLINTAGYIPTYFSNIIEGMTNPVNGFAGIMTGFICGMQKVLQTAETGLGALALAGQESDSEPREAGLISLIPTVCTIIVSIVVTSYIASYGLSVGIIEFPADSLTRLYQYFMTAQNVTGIFGLIILSMFTVLSGLTTILGSYYYLSKLFKDTNINKNITIYIILIVIAGTLAVFGVNILFEAVDLLLFVVCAINISALSLFTLKGWNKYKL